MGEEFSSRRELRRAYAEEYRWRRYAYRDRDRRRGEGDRARVGGNSWRHICEISPWRCAAGQSARSSAACA